MFPFKSTILLDRSLDTPIYIQLSNGLTHLVIEGQLARGTRLPGTRTMALQLQLHRKTVSLAYDELLSQGFIEVIPSKGTYVSLSIPVVQPKKFGSNQERIERNNAGFNFIQRPDIRKPYIHAKSQLTFDEGLPDLRLSPLDEIRRNYNNLLKRQHHLKNWSYGSPFGEDELRQALAAYLNTTRGLKVNKENVLITRGSQMGIYLSSKMILQKGHNVVTGHLNYQTANITFRESAANLVPLKVDGQGLDTLALEAICKKQKVRMVYVTPHHHHPTTATLSAERRVHLLQLARRFRFAILEDDYDYDFHYERAPLLPLASSDPDRFVIYIGGFSKIVSPAMRIGFLIGPEDFVREAGYLRRIIDRQGDNTMERVMAQMLSSGDILRHSKKSLRVYHERRDNFADRLSRMNGVNFQIPQGGMAIWCGFDQSISLERLTSRLHAEGLEIPDWRSYDPNEEGHNFLRLGFASLNHNEMNTACDILESALKTF